MSKCLGLAAVAQVCAVAMAVAVAKITQVMEADGQFLASLATVLRPPAHRTTD
jgi:hypothetical protein